MLYFIIPIIFNKKTDKIIIIKGELEIILALIAGIRIMLVTKSPPTILIVARTENESIQKAKGFEMVPAQIDCKIQEIVKTCLPKSRRS